MSPQLLLLLAMIGVGGWMYVGRRGSRASSAPDGASAGKTTKGRTGGSPHAPVPTPAPVLAALGLSRLELMLGGSAVALSAFLGLLLGGYFG